MAYRRSRWESQDKRFRIEKKYYSFRALPMRPEIREKRAKRQNVTKETQVAVNRRLRAERLSRLLMDNFAAGDWYLTCIYAEHPEAESVPKEFEKFKRKLRTIYKKAGVPMKYISVLENLTGAGRPHGHILLPALSSSDLEKVKKAWVHGSVAVKLYGGHIMDAERLADYYTKEKIAEHAGRLQTSRNLIRTEPKTETVTKAEAYKTEIQPPKGYRVIKELSYSTYTAEGYPLTIAYFEWGEQKRPPEKKQKQRKGDVNEWRQKTICGDYAMRSGKLRGWKRSITRYVQRSKAFEG